MHFVQRVSTCIDAARAKGALLTYVGREVHHISMVLNILRLC